MTKNQTVLFPDTIVKISEKTQVRYYLCPVLPSSASPARSGQLTPTIETHYLAVELTRPERKAYAEKIVAWGGYETPAHLVVKEAEQGSSEGAGSEKGALGGLNLGGGGAGAAAASSSKAPARRYNKSES